MSTGYITRSSPLSSTPGQNLAKLARGSSHKVCVAFSKVGAVEVGTWLLALLTQRVKIDDNCCNSSIVLA